jgi:hypothetical protein
MTIIIALSSALLRRIMRDAFRYPLARQRGKMGLVIPCSIKRE